MVQWTSLLSAAMIHFMWRDKWGRAIVVACIALIVIVASWYGVKLRRQVYDSTIDIHYNNDALNAYQWGRYSRATGLFNLYQRVEAGDSIRATMQLDYAPLRLTAANAWQAWTERHFPGPVRWPPDYEFTAPMLMGNTLAALVSAVMAFLLVRLWVIRMDEARNSEIRNSNVPRRWRGLWQGMLAALLVWFNPAALWDGYVWVQWEIWIVPFYLAAVYLACVDRWFAAGVVLGVGALIKPQLLVAASVLFVWPVFQFRFGALLRIIAGMGLTMMLICLPWFKATPAAFTWFVLILGSMGLIAPFVLRWEISPRWMIFALAALLGWPWASQAPVLMRMAPAMILIAIALSRFMPARLAPHAYALAVAVTIALMIPLFSASTAWMNRGFMYGPGHRGLLYQNPMYNIPSMAGAYLHWPNDADFIVKLPVIGDISVWAMMIGIHCICVILCGLGAAMQYRRNDARFLVAMVLPWLTFYMLLTQLQSRYLMWAAVVCGILTAVGMGMTLFGILISVLCALSIDLNMHEAARVAASYSYLRALDAHAGWMLLLIAAIMLYHALVPRTRVHQG